MAPVYVWHFGLVLILQIVPGQQHAGGPAAPEVLRVYREEDVHDLGARTMSIEWRDSSTDGTQSATYDLQIFHTQQMRLVHNETIEVSGMNPYQWNWTSPVPLQCTSHSVRLRLRDGALTGAWSHLYQLDGNDIHVTEDHIYPQNHVTLATEGIVFCCILKAEHVQLFTSSEFTIRISNQTYITEPVRHRGLSPAFGFDINCNDAGATFYTGYAPDVSNLTCETRDLRSVECRWRTERPTGFTSEIKDVKYLINGRDCLSDRCVLDDSFEEGVTNWTFIAENVLGRKSLFDRADPKHRVRLRAPVDAHAVLISARNATLQWKWEELKYSKLSMICQVELNERIVDRTFNGVGLRSAVLEDLDPFTEYSARVRCASQDHFYKWGDWSDGASFLTLEDVPEAVDVWVEVLGGETYVVWKGLNASQSHGLITGYDLVWGGSMKDEPIRISADELCYKIHPASVEGHHVISVSAKNSAGVSNPSSIEVSNLHSRGAAVNVSGITAHHGGFDLRWKLSPVSTCGYVVEWYPTYGVEPCAIQWKRFPPEVSKASIYSDFEAGVRYTLSVYACTSGVAQLLQRSEGYVEERAPSGEVQNLRIEQHGWDILFLSWDDVPKNQHRGFIKGYNVSYRNIGGNKTHSVIQDSGIRSYNFTLPADTYEFTVKAFTSAGEGPASPVTKSMDPPTKLIIIVIVAVMAFTAWILAIVYSKRKRLVSVLYPDIPKPHFSEAWLKKELNMCQLIDKLLLAETEVLTRNNTAPAQIVLDRQREHDKAQLHNIYSTKPEDPQWTQSPGGVCKPGLLEPIAVDSSYIEVPCSGIRNPTYNLDLTLYKNDLTPPVNYKVVLVPGYLPQTEHPSHH